LRGPCVLRRPLQRVRPPVRDPLRARPQGPPCGGDPWRARPDPSIPRAQGGRPVRDDRGPHGGGLRAADRGVGGGPVTFRQARYDEPLLCEKTRPAGSEVDLFDVPVSLRRKRLDLPQVSEHEVVRHYTRLSQMNFGIDTGFYPLGSCTMKFNPKFNEELARLPEMARVHPDQDPATVQGILQILYELQVDIARIVHDAGALLYYDGANFNAILGKTSPGKMGFDITHFNTHKTFTTPHGGGGPGAGPVGVKAFLEPFLPVPIITFDERTYGL